MCGKCRRCVSAAQIKQLVHRCVYVILAFLLHIPRRTWGSTCRSSLKRVGKAFCRDVPLAPASLCAQLLWQPSSVGSILIALQKQMQNTCWPHRCHRTGQATCRVERALRGVKAAMLAPITHAHSAHCHCSSLWKVLHIFCWHSGLFLHKIQHVKYLIYNFFRSISCLLCRLSLSFCMYNIIAA